MTAGRRRAGLALAGIALVGLASPGPAGAEATPMFTVTQELAMDTIKGAAGEGLKYYAPQLYLVSKTVDFGLDAGNAGVEAQDRTLGQQMVRSEELGRRLKHLQAAHISTRDSPEANAIKEELYGLSREMATDKDGLAYAAYAVGKHPVYALGKPLLKLAIKKQLDGVWEKVGLAKFVKRLPFGRKVKQLLGRESPFRLYRRVVGWDNLASRSTAARVVNDELIKSMIKASAEKFVKAFLGSAEERVRGDVWLERYNALHRQPLVYTGRLEVARMLLPVVPAAPLPAVALPPAVAAAPRAYEVVVSRPAALVPFDPVGRVVGSEDLLVSAAQTMSQGPVEREPEIRQGPEPPEVSMREDDRHVPDVDVGSFFRGKSFDGNSIGVWGF
jgi:hypothetical protein